MLLLLLVSIVVLMWGGWVEGRQEVGYRGSLLPFCALLLACGRGSQATLGPGSSGLWGCRVVGWGYVGQFWVKEWQSGRSSVEALLASWHCCALLLAFFDDERQLFGGPLFNLSPSRFWA